MNKSELIDAVAKKAGTSKADTARVVDALFSTDGGVIVKALKKGDRVQMTGFGTFERRQRKARTGRNPQTGETIKISASKVPAFKAGKGFKDAL